MASIGMRKINSMLAKFGVGAMLAVTGILSGCVDNTTVIEVKKDGSGFVSEVTYVSPAMDKMMNQMMQGMMSGMTNAADPDGGKIEIKMTKTGNDKLLDRKQYEAKAAEMGEGVSVANVTEMKRKDGAVGVRVDYAFKDIAKLRMNAGSSPMPTPGLEGGMETGKPAKKSQPMVFAFTPGTPSRLTITMPPDETPAPAGTIKLDEMAETNALIKGGEQPSSDPKDKAMEDTMKSMLKDFRMSLRIKVDGEILKSNATFVQVGGTSHKKQYVTLYNIEFGKIVSDPELFAKYGDKLNDLQTMGDSPDAKAILTNLPGIQVETAKKIEIEFD